MVLLRHTISTTYYGITSISCKKTQYITMMGQENIQKKCVVR